MQLPVRVEQCPIVDAVVEIRFTSNVPPSVMLGLIYRELAQDFPDVEDLPILQLPEHIRVQGDLSLQAHHRLISEEFVVQLGPRVLSVLCKIPYPGWDRFSKVVFKVFTVAHKAGIVQTVNRLGVRYINGFETDVFDLLNISLHLSDKPVKCREARLKNTIFSGDGYRALIQVFNDSPITSIDGRVYKSGVDIDIMKDYTDNTFFESFEAQIEMAHRIEKEHFFRLVKGEVLDSLKPHYT